MLYLADEKGKPTPVARSRREGRTHLKACGRSRGLEGKDLNRYVDRHIEDYMKRCAELFDAQKDRFKDLL